MRRIKRLPNDINKVISVSPTIPNQDGGCRRSFHLFYGHQIIIDRQIETAKFCLQEQLTNEVFDLCQFIGGLLLPTNMYNSLADISFHVVPWKGPFDGYHVPLGEFFFSTFIIPRQV